MAKRRLFNEIKKQMKRPTDIIESGEYQEPHSFENDREAVLFYSYIEQIDYIKHLEEELNKLRLGVVVGRSEQCSQCRKLPDGEIAISSAALTNPDWKE